MPAPRRALFVTPFVWEAGREVGKPTVYYILRGFRDRGYEVHVVSAAGGRAGAPDEIDGLVVHHVRPPWNPGGIDYDAQWSFLTAVRRGRRPWARHAVFRAWWLQFVWLTARRAHEIARRLPPDFTYGVNNPGIPPAWHVARRLGVPSFARIMGSEIAQLAGVDLDGRPGGTAPRPGPLTTLRLLPTRFDELLAFRLATDAVIVTDDGQVGPRTVTGWLGVPAERLWLWRNGVDRAGLRDGPGRAESRAGLDLPSDRPVVLWVSQLIDWKQPHLLVDAVPALRAACPEAMVVVVGDGPARSDLAARAAGLGVGDAVRFVGAVPRRDVNAYYRAADAFVAMYRRANVSNTLLEAMVSGLPVVALDNGRTSEVVRDGETGLLVSPHRPGDVAGALTRLLSDDALRGRLGAAAAEWAERNVPTWEERIEREIDAIEVVVARRRGRPGGLARPPTAC